MTEKRKIVDVVDRRGDEIRPVRRPQCLQIPKYRLGRVAIQSASDEAPLPRQLLHRKEGTEHGLLAIEVELVGACKASFYLLAQRCPPRGVGASG